MRALWFAADVSASFALAADCMGLFFDFCAEPSGGPAHRQAGGLHGIISNFLRRLPRRSRAVTGMRRYECINALYPVSTNCMPMAVTMSPMNRVTMACVLWLMRDPN